MLRNMLVVGLMALCCDPSQAQTFLGKNVQTWLGELENRDPTARRNAAFALGKLGSDEARPALKKRLKTDTSADVCEAAAFALGEIAVTSLAAFRDAELSAVLCEALKHNDPMVRRSAAYAIGCLGQQGAPALGNLATALGDEQNRNHPAVRQNVAWALGKLVVSTTKVSPS